MSKRLKNAVRKDLFIALWEAGMPKAVLTNETGYINPYGMAKFLGLGPRPLRDIENLMDEVNRIRGDVFDRHRLKVFCPRPGVFVHLLPAIDAEEHDRLIAEHISLKGITKCPTAFVAATPNAAPDPATLIKIADDDDGPNSPWCRKKSQRGVQAARRAMAMAPRDIDKERAA